MNLAQIQQWVKALGGEASGTGPVWVHAACPFAFNRHEKGEDCNPSFGVLIKPGESRVYCLACGYAGSQSQVLVDLASLKAEGVDYKRAWQLIWAAEDDSITELESEAYDEEVAQPLVVPHIYPEYLLDIFEPAYEDGEVHPYLTERQMPYEVAEFLDMRWDMYRNRILFPVRDECKRLRGLHGRHVGGPFAPEDPHVKYKMYPFEGTTNADIWLGEHWYDPQRTLVIAESVFDLARVLEVYDNVITPLTASIRQRKIQRIQDVRSVVTIFDEDKAGQRARLELQKNLPNSRVRHIRMKHGTDAADHSAEELFSLLQPFLGLLPKI